MGNHGFQDDLDKRIIIDEASEGTWEELVHPGSITVDMDSEHGGFCNPFELADGVVVEESENSAKTELIKAALDMMESGKQSRISVTPPQKDESFKFQIRKKLKLKDLNFFGDNNPSK
jgi:hypothetical protein